jgi:Holliday junction resolvase RusA-like endonuclease
VTTNKVLDTEQALTLVLPLPLNLGNSRLHYMAKHRKKEAYWEQLDLRKSARMIPGPPLTPPSRAAVDICLYVWTKNDPDNKYSRVKFALDWLRTRGYIAGDREDQIELVVTQKVDRKNQRMQVTITPIDCAVTQKSEEL